MIAIVFGSKCPDCGETHPQIFQAEGDDPVTPEEIAAIMIEAGYEANDVHLEPYTPRKGDERIVI